MARKKTKEEDVELFDDIKKAQPANKSELKVITTFAKQALELQSKIEQMEEMVKVHRQELHAITTNALPQAMKAVGMDDFTLTTGERIEIKDFLAGSLPKDPQRRNIALQWLQQNGGESLIKNTLDIDLGKGEGKTAREIEAFLRKKKVDYSTNEGIHPQTLLAFARERLENGEPVPLELLGLFAGQSAKIHPPKLTKAQKAARNAARTTTREPVSAPPAKVKGKPDARKAPMYDELNPPPHPGF